MTKAGALQTPSAGWGASSARPALQPPRTGLGGRSIDPDFGQFRPMSANNAPAPRRRADMNTSSILPDREVPSSLLEKSPPARRTTTKTLHRAPGAGLPPAPLPPPERPGEGPFRIVSHFFGVNALPGGPPHAPITTTRTVACPRSPRVLGASCGHLPPLVGSPREIGQWRTPDGRRIRFRLISDNSA